MPEVEELDEITEDAPPEGESPEQMVARLQRANEKLRKENIKQRVENRTAKLAAEFGAEVAGVVPKDLDIEKAREYAQNFTAKWQPVTEPTTEVPQASDQGIPEIPSPLAAVSQPSSGSPASGLFTMAQIDEIAKSDPSRAREIVASGNWDKG